MIREMESQEPYQFSCTTSKSDCLTVLKRKMARNGFTIQQEDMETGIFTVTKTLNKKEKVSTSEFTELTTGTESAGQTGKLSFIFTEKDEAITLEMNGQVSIKVNEEQDFSSTKETQTSEASQGHPLMVRYGKMLNGTEPLELESPSPRKIQQG